MTAIGSQIRNDADLAHAQRVTRYYRRARFWHGVVEAIAITVLFTGIFALYAAWLAR